MGLEVDGADLSAYRRADTEMLREAVAIRSQRRILKPVLRSAVNELSEAIALAGRDVFEIGKNGLAVRLSADESFPMLAHVLPLTAGELKNQSGSTAVAAVFIRARENTHDNAELLALTYGLTSAETRVVSCLLAGRSVSEGARELRVTPTTARTHLRSIFRKTGAAASRISSFSQHGFRRRSARVDVTTAMRSRYARAAV
jgi:DNA-binding NarL/FixJ family response regulator